MSLHLVDVLSSQLSNERQSSDWIAIVAVVAYLGYYLLEHNGIVNFDDSCPEFAVGVAADLRVVH